MTKCAKNEVNIKSSAYNQTGQNYFEQLAAYNSMSSHLRRILLARSVIDTRNKNYVFRKNKQCKTIGDKRAYSLPEIVDDVIDRLAYDTRHHPMDILRMSLNPKYLNCYCNLEQCQSRACSSRACYERHHHRHRSIPKSQRTTSPISLPKRTKFTPISIYGKKLKDTRGIPRVTGPSMCCSQQRKCKYETSPIFVPCTTTILHDSSGFKASRSAKGKMNDHRSASSSASHSDDSDYDDKFVEQLVVSKQLPRQKEEDKKYVKFVYDITKEIMQNGLYTDKELQDVFKKHIEQNKGILNMNKMLYEIYQLKISLNITEDESEADDELEDLIHAQKLLRVAEIRPPTPPKVLDENKVMGKLKSYQEAQLKPSNGTSKSVVLVDANPELFITERDVLMSLIEVGIDPKQAQHICKSLLYKSKDASLTKTVQVPAEASQPLNLQLKEELRDNDRQTSLVTQTVESARSGSTDGKSARSYSAKDNLTDDYSADDYTADYSEKQEASSSTSNLVSATQDETTETKEQIDSQETSDRKVES